MTRREYCKQKGIIVFLPDMDEEVDDDFLNFLNAVEYHTLIHQEKKELKKCPFCGGEVFIPMDFSEWSTVVVCKKCHANSGYYDTTEEAIEAWNTRADADIRAKAIDEFVDRIEYELGAEEEDIYCKEVVREIAEQMRKVGVNDD